MTRSRHLILVLLLGSLPPLTGCGPSGPSMGAVTGKVVYKNEPIPEGTVSFLQPGTGAGAEVPLGPGGQFTVENPIPVGTYQVSVSPPPPAQPDNPDARPVVKATRIPRKAQDRVNSGLTVTVAEGKNEVTIELKD